MHVRISVNLDGRAEFAMFDEESENFITLSPTMAGACFANLPGAAKVTEVVVVGYQGNVETVAAPVITE